MTKKSPPTTRATMEAVAANATVELNGEAAALEPEKPEPKPGEAGYDWSTHYDTDDLYIHTFADGKVVALKPFSAIYSKTWLYKVKDLPTVADVEFAAIDRAACPTAKEVLLSLDDSGDGDPIEELFEAWTSAGTSRGNGDKGLTPGN